MFSIFKPKPKHTSLDFIGVDIHSHVLPGIDDGSSDVQTSVKFIKALHELGYEALIATPHILGEIYPNNRQTIGEALSVVQQELIKENVNIPIQAAAEYMVDGDFIPKLQEGNLLTLNDNYVLIEMSYAAETMNIEQYIFELRVKGYQPVLAHPERYRYYHKTFEQYRRLKDMGCLFQLNLLSLSSYYGNTIHEIALKLLKLGMIDLVGTDLHHPRHLEQLQYLTQTGKLWGFLGNYPIRNVELFSCLPA